MSKIFNGRVYSVGDGFCYEGFVGKEKEYHFVVDCGNEPSKRSAYLATVKACEKRLEEITDKIVGRRIDLFVLTHFHKDHYSGYQELFRKTEIDTIIMPYLYPAERLYIIISNGLSGDEAAFLANPYTSVFEAAKEKNPNARLVLVRGTVGEEYGSDNIEFNDNREELWGMPYEDAEEVIEKEELPQRNVSVVRTTLGGVRIPKVTWLFKFYNFELKRKERKKLESVVGTISAKKLNEIISDNVLCKKIKDEYEAIGKKVGRDLNDTSIVVYHGPLLGDNRAGCLLTGDICLKGKRSAVILNFFRNEINKVGVFSLPHHGSKYSWSKKFISCGALDNTVCFASSCNYYPNRLTTDMMSDLRMHNIQVLMVDENRVSELSQEIWEDCFGAHCCIIRRNLVGLCIWVY